MRPDYEALTKRSLSQRDVTRISEALVKLNRIGTEFDGVLKQYDERGVFFGLYWMDTESEEWLFDPQGTVDEERKPWPSEAAEWD